ncbi:bifunctional dTDP-4-dehydrorhamnose 3,5-epimerase family protein/NAD(P)-dependent oxidoreductase [Microbacterium foliorum]|uniref:bifunctional dTDP-4-dehydrorhamnose 3,5-epimerase family protein/NAD(P)-dependent oxidoreductase n=1 Tax=Microbacterium foliorum TaxID=104336 RepID=UPI0028D63BFF|nr:bifunctional dTDP-4-dehydrorhamnose 3,5-epimerase family protein/NAD(P)-dependent oxidoreductase [Microbacterium foliorum]
MTEYSKQLASTPTPIPGLQLWDLPVHGDSRGWFKENWQREKMVAAGLPDFAPVQNNVSFNDAIGTTRGIHAEPWDKWVSVATGRVFGAWVDLREGPSFGAVFTAEIDPSVAVFVPRGVGNAYQTLEADTAYTYLVNAHWSPDVEYSFLNLADETAAVPWPISLADAEVSDKDRAHPRLPEVRRVGPGKTLVVGANGQLGKALREIFEGRTEIEFAGRSELDVENSDLSGARRWSDYTTIINASAYTAVDDAETPEGRRGAWSVNVSAVRRLAEVARDHGLTFVHISSDYVFDGSQETPYSEDHPVAPLGVYGQTKAAGETAAALAPRHYVLRTSWVVGDGNNFVRTMASLAARGVSPSVVDDQRGRLTFADELASGIDHLLTASPAYGIYNLTNTGDPATWADIARTVFEITGNDPSRVTGVSTTEYFADAERAIAPRPRNSVLDLRKIEATGFHPTPMLPALTEYLTRTD